MATVSADNTGVAQNGGGPKMPRTLLTKGKSCCFLCVYKNVWVKAHKDKDGNDVPARSMPAKRTSIGKILEPDGIGEVFLYDDFLEEYPELRLYRVMRVGKSQFEFIPREPDPKFGDMPSLRPRMPNTLLARSTYGWYLCTYKNKWTPAHTDENGNFVPGSSRPIRRNSIGKINSPDGLGEVILYPEFLKQHPEFIGYKVVRTGKNTFDVTPYEEEETGAVSLPETVLTRSKSVWLVQTPLTVWQPSHVNEKGARVAGATYEGKLISIGSISSKDGTGPVKLYERFLARFPKYMGYDVYRAADGKFHFHMSESKLKADEQAAARTEKNRQNRKKAALKASKKLETERAAKKGSEKKADKEASKANKQAAKQAAKQ